MENKSENIFDKLDHQQEKIDDISVKLEGISIIDLYALAKRTFDYGDYETAQKYYNHISLLNPIDWKAPLYASLCNFHGYHDIFYWAKSIEKMEKILYSTIEYINNLSHDENSKEKETKECIEILKDEIIIYRNLYIKYKERFDKEDINYIYDFEYFYVKIIDKFKENNTDYFNDFKTEMANCCLELIENSNRISLNITKETFLFLLNICNKEYNIDFDNIVLKESIIKDKTNLLPYEIKEIKLKGIKYFEYNDKIIAKRITRKLIFIGMIVTVFSIIGFINSLINLWFMIFPFIYSIVYGILILIKAFTQKKRIKCSSILSYDRNINRLDSNENIVRDDKINIFSILNIFNIFLTMCLLFAIISLSLDLKEYNLFFYIVNLISSIPSIILYYVMMAHYENHSNYNGKILYFYNNTYYDLK